jgi:hypothetical protein
MVCLEDMVRTRMRLDAEQRQLSLFAQGRSWYGVRVLCVENVSQCQISHS